MLLLVSLSGGDRMRKLAGQADSDEYQPALFRGLLDAECTVPFDLGETIAVQGVWFLDELTVQVNCRIPLGDRAAVALHYVEQHATQGQRWCDYDHCPVARAWLGAPSRTNAVQLPQVSA